jgi:hypothetical protein
MLSMLSQLDQDYAKGGADNPTFNFGANNFAEPVMDQSNEQFQSGGAFNWPAESPFEELAFEPISTPQFEK